MCDFACKHAFTDFARIAALATPYSDEDLEQLGDNTQETFREDNYLDNVFGNTSRLEYEAWVTAHTKNAVYMFSASELRKKYLGIAGLPNRY
jgi:hypothetical protein